MPEPQDISRIEILSRLPLFSSFDRRELERLAPLFVEESYRRGEVICREGESGDTLYVIASGELEVWQGEEPKQLIARLGAGELVGEMTLLTGGPRTATVGVVRAARLLALNRSEFDRYFRTNAKVLEHLSQILCRRLVMTSRQAGDSARVRTVGVVAGRGLVGCSIVTEAVAGFLQDESGHKVLIVRMQREAPESGSSVSPPAFEELAALPGDMILSRLKPGTADPTLLEVGVRTSKAALLVDAANTLVEKLAGVFGAIVFDLGTADRGREELTREVCDSVVRIVAQAEPEPTANVFEVVNLFNEASEPIAINHCNPYVIPVDPNLREGAIHGARRLRQDPWSPATPPLRRLARKISGAAVGLALGGGAAFGLANIGVLKVLEEAGIFVDLVAGTSFGSIIALGYAGGMRAERMVELALEKGTIGTLLSALDFTLTKPSFLTGDRLAKIFMPMSGPIQRFEQLALPCRMVATDIESGERVTLGSGDLEPAFRASCAVPMIWPPVVVDGRKLVDGGVVDPVPADVVREMGADVCIAVNVVPSLKRGVETFLSKAYRGIQRLNPLSYLGGREDLPSMLDLVMNSLQTLQYELGNFKAISADVRVNPDLSEFTWMTFYRPQELIDRGAEATERALPAIRRALEERAG